MGAVQCSLLVLWKQLVSEVGTREKMCLTVGNVSAERMGDYSRRLDQPHIICPVAKLLPCPEYEQPVVPSA